MASWSDSTPSAKSPPPWWSRLLDAVSPDTLYNEYVALFDEKLQSFVDEAGTTQEAFLAEAQGASGLHEAYLQIFLAHAEYDTFIELMAEQAEKQSS